MNRAKIMLSALGVLAVIGSALAFKAHKAYNGTLRCTTTTATAATTACPVGTYRITDEDDPQHVIRRCTNLNAPAGTQCQLLTVEFAD